MMTEADRQDQGQLIREMADASRVHAAALQAQTEAIAKLTDSWAERRSDPLTNKWALSVVGTVFLVVLSAFGSLVWTVMQSNLQETWRRLDGHSALLAGRGERLTALETAMQNQVSSHAEIGRRIERLEQHALFPGTP